MDAVEFVSKTQTLIIASEGHRRRRYFDSEGVPSIGIGFNLERPDAVKKLRELGADPWAIMDGTAELTDAQVDKLFGWCFEEAITYARKLFPNWAELIIEAQMVLVDMSFQMNGRLRGYVKMRAAIARLDYPSMVKEMRNSKQAKQTPTRCARNCAIIEAAIAPPPAPSGEGDPC